MWRIDRLGHLAAYSISLLSGAVALIQTAGTSADQTGLLPQVERLTLVGALVAAVTVLWRALNAIAEKKDAVITHLGEQIAQMTAKTTEALIVSAEAQRELRAIVQESTLSKQELTRAIDSLGAMMRIDRATDKQ